VRLANGCRASGGFLEGVGLPHKVLPLFQIVETCVPFCSAHGLVAAERRADCCRRIRRVPAHVGDRRGGYRHDTIGEDMELVRAAASPASHGAAAVTGSGSCPIPICWTKAPKICAPLRAQPPRAGSRACSKASGSIADCSFIATAARQVGWRFQ